ncbi:hypothetical protein [Escherichia coli]|uniref:hypothetical protein n=1 Tax=Escherichia coli TaxID=562 RepID=UPI001E5A3F53|nr:hypothetical protein [Escherichia coli]MCD6800244.1 hypothetical protein [Escherichia coli]
MGKNDVNQIADNVRVVHAGCGVNALSGLQVITRRPDKRSASGNLTLVISLMPITLLMWWWVN